MAAVEIPFDLLEIKLAEPFARPDTVAKPDVVARLSAATAPFATVVAPAGYGKTTLLSQWAAADPRPFAWVALDTRDDDALVFMRYITAALHRVEPIRPEVLGALSGPGGSNWWTRIPRVGSALAALEHPLVLVLDDLHLVANPSCLDVLAELFQYVPAGSQIAVTSREEPALPLGTWRAEGRVHEIGVSDLRLDECGAAQLLQAAGVELDADELSRLTDQTEGWPAGLYLAALSLQTGAGATMSVESFNGDDRFISEYFRNELLDRMPGAKAQFLKCTSVLDRMCGSLCDELLQTSGSAQMLEQLERTNGFVIPLDRRGEWYRYHHLFGQLLRNELERSDPDMTPALNRRAMDWFIANDMTEEAVAYGHAAGEAGTVAGLVDALALPVYYDGRLETLEEWLSWFSQDELIQYPALAVYSAWVGVLTGRPDDAERLLSLADGATSAIPLSDGSATIEPWVATLRSHMMPDGVERALADAQLALDTFAEGSYWIPTALLARGHALALLGSTDRARDDLTAVVERAEALGAVEEVYVAQAQLALLAAKQGNWGEAAEQARAAQTLVDERGLAGYSSTALTHMATARIALHQGRYEDARAAVTRAQRLRPALNHGLPWSTIQVGFELIRAHLALGEPGAARTILAETEAVLELRPNMGSLVDEAQDLRDYVAAASGSDGAWAMSLTGAELRLLPYLATHLTFPEVASRLFISRNTVKTEAVSIYRKLGASSRSQAIERAVEVGLLDSSIYPAPANLTPGV